MKSEEEIRIHTRKPAGLKLSSFLAMNY